MKVEKHTTIPQSHDISGPPDLFRRQLLKDSFALLLLEHFNLQDFFNSDKKIEGLEGVGQVLRPARNAMDNLVRFLKKQNYRPLAITGNQEIDLLYDPLGLKLEILYHAAESLAAEFDRNPRSFLNLSLNQFFSVFDSMGLSYLSQRYHLPNNEKASQYNLVHYNSPYGITRAWLPRLQRLMLTKTVEDDSGVLPLLPTDVTFGEGMTSNSLAEYVDITTRLSAPLNESGRLRISDSITIDIQRFNEEIAFLQLNDERDIQLLKARYVAHELAHYYDLTSNQDLNIHIDPARLAALYNLRMEAMNFAYQLAQNTYLDQQSVENWLFDSESKTYEESLQSLSYPYRNFVYVFGNLVIPDIPAEIVDEYELSNFDIDYHVLPRFILSTTDLRLSHLQLRSHALFSYWESELFAELASITILCKLGYLDDRVSPEEQVKIRSTPVGQYIDKIVSSLNIQSGISDLFRQAEKNWDKS